MCETSSYPTYPWTVSAPVWSWLRQTTFPSGRRGRWEVRAPLQGPRGPMVAAASVILGTRQEMFSRNRMLLFSAMFRSHCTYYTNICTHMTWHDITLHYNALQCNALQSITVHDITWHCITWHCITWQCIPLHYSTIHYNTLQHTTTHTYSDVCSTWYVYTDTLDTPTHCLVHVLSIW